MDKENWVQEWWCRGMKILVGFKWYIALIWLSLKRNCWRLQTSQEKLLRRSLNIVGNIYDNVQ